MLSECIHSDSKMEEQVSLELEEVSKVKDSLVKDSIELDKELVESLKEYYPTKDKIIIKMISQTKKSFEKRFKIKLLIDKNDLITQIDKQMLYCNKLSDEECAKYLNVSLNEYWDGIAIKQKKKKVMTENSLKQSNVITADEEYFKKAYKC